jgi:hypothetical protein
MGVERVERHGRIRAGFSSFHSFSSLSLSLSPSLSLFSVREGNGERKLVDLPFDNAHASQKFTMKSSRSLKPSTVSYSLSL